MGVMPRVRMRQESVVRMLMKMPIVGSTVKVVTRCAIIVVVKMGVRLGMGMGVKVLGRGLGLFQVFCRQVPELNMRFQGLMLAIPR